MKAYIDSWCSKHLEVHIECENPMFRGETTITRVQKDGFWSQEGRFFSYTNIDNIVGPMTSIVRKKIQKTELDFMLGEKIREYKVIDIDDIGVAFKDDSGLIVMVIPHDSLK